MTPIIHDDGVVTCERDGLHVGLRTMKSQERNLAGHLSRRRLILAEAYPTRLVTMPILGHLFRLRHHVS